MVEIATYKTQLEAIAAALNIAWSEDVTSPMHPARQLGKQLDFDAVSGLWVVNNAYIDAFYAGQFPSKQDDTEAVIASKIPAPPSAVITTAAGTTIAPAVMTLGGDWSGQVASYSLTLTPANTISGSLPLTGTAAAAASALASDITGKSANTTASAVGNTVEILASGTATNILIDTLTIS